MKTHVTNPPNATCNLHVGGTVIRPGETRLCEVPGEPATDKQAAVSDDPIKALAEGTVKDITSALPGLGDEDLVRLRELEAQGKDRSTLLEAIDETMLERAAAAGEGAGGEEIAGEGAGDEESGAQ